MQRQRRVVETETCVIQPDARIFVQRTLLYLVYNTIRWRHMRFMRRAALDASSAGSEDGGNSARVALIRWTDLCN